MLNLKGADMDDYSQDWEGKQAYLMDEDLMVCVKCANILEEENDRHEFMLISKFAQYPENDCQVCGVQLRWIEGEY